MRYMLWMLGDAGEHHRGQRLRPAAEAVTVRVRDGEVRVTEGPFADTSQHIGAFEIVDVPDLDQAIEIASGHPAGVEIRPFHPAEH
ncbi:YciI family protein [Actinoplanes sp. DH11]|uniref:YciI family protein n=1 Tax=Actinoplanes sp. DH11 TaxID=2857011 RepID=UPI001E5E8DE2|nr:YciI family protein [Actinoplanes sp. DH11]